MATKREINSTLKSCNNNTMTVNEKAQFKQAYLDTTYVLKTDAIQFNLKINVFHPDFNNWLKANNINTWVKMTAANPYSQMRSKSENEYRNAHLETALRQLKYTDLYFSEGRPSDENWQTEIGFFIPNIKLITALELARQYEQNAIVYGYINGVPQLVWA